MSDNQTSNAHKVEIDDVRHVATLANLQLTEDELPRMQRDLNNVLANIAQLNTVNTEGVSPLAQVSELLGEGAHSRWLREDAPVPSVDRKAVMAEAPETDGRFFKVPKVIER